MTKINNVQKSVKRPCLTFNFSFFWFFCLEVQLTSISDVCVLYFLLSSFFWPNIPSAFSLPLTLLLFFSVWIFQVTTDYETVSSLLGILIILNISNASIKTLPHIFLVQQVTDPKNWVIWAPHYIRHDDQQLHDLDYPISGISCNSESTRHLNVEGIVIVN